MSDEERREFLRYAYEHILNKVSDGTGRNVGRILKYLRESDFYTIPCRHHAFVGGNAWHQLETLVYAYVDCSAIPCAMPDFNLWRPQWHGLEPMSIAMVSLLHDVCNSRHPKLQYPGRIMRRHGRKSTYILKDFLHFELMFDENMAIIHHRHKTEQDLQEFVLNDVNFKTIWEMPLYHMIRCCDSLSILSPIAEQALKERLIALEKYLLPPGYDPMCVSKTERP